MPNHNHFQTGRRKLGLLLSVALASTFALHSQIVFTSLSPASGAPGTEVLLAGAGFPATGSLTVTVGGINASILERTTDLIRFTVPAAATSGSVKVTAGGSDYRFGAPFTVTRFLTAQIDPQLQIVASNYTVGTLYGDAPGTGPNYAVQVAKGEPTIVAASASDADPVLMAVVTDTNSSIVLNSQSTALALLFVMPGIQTLNHVEAVARLDFFAARPDTAALANAIQSLVAAGQDYLEHPSVGAPMIALVDAFLNEYQPTPPPPLIAQGAGVTRDDFVNEIQTLAAGYPRDLEAPGYEKLRNLVTSSAGPGVNDRGLPVLKVKVKSAPAGEGLEPLREYFDVNPLDWMANLYELDPNDADLNSFDKVKNLRGDFSNVYDRLSPHPVDRLHVKAKPAFRYVDLPELAADQLMSFLAPAVARKEHLEVPADRSGLYLIRAFSGARFDPQATLINNLPEGRREANVMRALNLVLAAQDALGFTAKEGLGGDCADKFFISLLVSTSQTVEREAAQGTLSSEAVVALFLNAAKSFAKDYVAKCLILNSNRKGISGNTKVLIANINVLGKIASIGKIVERLNALGNIAGSSGEPQRVWTAQAIEDTLVVVGNPWQPRITGFFPQSDYRGATVRIDGRNFSTVTNLNIVTFGVLTTDPTNPPVAARAEVLAASDTSLIVRVPENASTGAISVTVTGKGSATTTDLSPPFQTFAVLPDPVITAIVPNPPVAGQVMLIHGSNFARITDRQELVFSAGPVTLPVVGSPTLLPVRAPNSIAPNSVKVRIRGRESNPFPFTPILPAIIPTGGTITISTTADGNVTNDVISLREAILLAAGGTTALGRPLTSPPDPRPNGVTYETDFVTGNPGAATRDSITVYVLLVGQTLLVNSQLPDLESYDNYDLRCTVSGGGGSGDAFRIPGKSEIVLQVDAIRNFSGHGIAISGTASNNSITDTLVEQCGGDGYRLEGNASGNTLVAVTARECLNGIHLNGAGVLYNKIEGANLQTGGKGGVFIENQQFGVLIENGASLNELSTWSVSSNTAGGVRIAGAETAINLVRGLDLTGGGGTVFDNGGPGIWINSPANVIHTFNIAGNQGDGILLEDSSCEDTWINDVRVGYASSLVQARPNQGSGLHVRNGARGTVIGTADGDATIAEISNVDRFNCFAGNRDHGIWIEGAGTRNIRINRTVVGAGRTAFNSSVAFPNGTNGIAVTGNAHSIEIGGAIHASVVVVNHTNGAGIYLARTTNNYVAGCILGREGFTPGRLGNKYGLHLTEGAYANVIGMRGLAKTLDSKRIYDTRNHFFGNVEAGILIESGGDPTRTIVSGEVPAGGNVIQNNLFGDRLVSGFENKIGILMRQGAIINRIGGTGPTERNYFSGNTVAGILIDGAVISRSFLANRIIGNDFNGQGSRVASPGDPLAGLTSGVGIALINGASGHVIGGKNPGEANAIWDNYAGVHMVQSRSNQVIGNAIYRNKASGVVLLQSEGNTVGPFNELYRNGTITSLLGGVVLKSSTSNSVIGNWIGLRNGFTSDFGDGNKPYGIGVFDSPANLLGDLGGKNIIVGHTNGIVISGAASAGNQVAHNHIGFSPVPGVFTTGNTQAGVLLTNGAHDNIIGGERTVQVGSGFVSSPAPNYIQRNSVDGVRVDGPSTLGNSILYNSIADHSAGIGIQNLNGGNSEIPPPALISHNGLEVIAAAAVPDGSRVQFFSDNADEGRTFLGEESVAGGQVRFLIPAFAGTNINATLTHGLQGETSEFAPLIIHTNNTAGLLVQRVIQPPAAIPLPVPGPVGVAVAFRLRALGSPVLVASVVFRATGSANESALGTQMFLYRDEDRNALLSQTDFLLSGPRTFATDNANITFPTLGRVINPGEEQHWLLVLLASTNAAAAQTFFFDLPTETFVTSRSLLTGEPIAETGEFPLSSDTLLVSAGQPPPGDLTLTRALNGELVLQWTGGGLLETAAAVTGPWSLVPDASVPFSIVPTEAQQFFRFRP